MSDNISCSVVRDLLPNYIDKLTSEETNSIIEKHLETCQSCSGERDEMMEQTETNLVSQNQDFRKYLNKTKIIYLLKGILLSLGIIGMVVCFIVDIAINHKFSWSLIVDMGTVFCYCVGLTALYSKKQKMVKAFFIGSILLLPMLYGFEHVVKSNFLAEPVKWFGRYALPITLIWLIILWITIFLKKIIKLNIWNTLGMLSAMTIIGSALTNAIAQQISVKQTFITNYEWIDSLSYAACAIVLFIIGNIRKK